MKPQTFQKANLVFSIQIVNRVAEPRIYQVRTSGDDVRSFFVGITPTQNSRHGVKFFIQTWCAQQRHKWPKDGETITMIWMSSGRRAATRIVLPRIQPMRLTRVAKPFDDPDYVFELKHDGFRALAYIENSTCRLVSRNLNHFKSFDLLKKSLDKLPVQNAILDGEVVCLDSNGVSQFNELPARQARLLCFRLLWSMVRICGVCPHRRKHRLHELIQKSDCPRIIYAQHMEGQGVGFFQEICQRDLEGIVCKRKRGIYKSNGTGWLKVKNPTYSQAEGRHDLFKRDRQ